MQAHSLTGRWSVESFDDAVLLELRPFISAKGDVDRGADVPLHTCGTKLCFPFDSEGTFFERR